VIFHEHDSPGVESGPWLKLRKWLARRARLNVLPNEARAQAFREQTGAHLVQVVRNFPSVQEVASPREQRRGRFVLHYHGNISPQLLPLAVVEALKDLPSDVVLRIVGYETIGNVGYCKKIMETGASFGVAERILILPAVPRFELLEICRDADVGLAFFPAVRKAADSFAGASNKVFDYLCSGLPVLCADNSEWRALFSVDARAISHAASDADSIRMAVFQLYSQRQDVHRMGECGRRRILAEWNYEAEFQPVLKILRSHS
jgi:glycosyltransferase involved in cell wall biosynthesis